MALSFIAASRLPALRSSDPDIAGPNQSLKARLESRDRFVERRDEADELNASCRLRNVVDVIRPAIALRACEVCGIDPADRHALCLFREMLCRAPLMRAKVLSNVRAPQ